VCVVGVCVYFYLCTDFFFRSHTHIPTTTNFDAFFKYTWFYVQNIFTWKILNHSFCQMRMHTPWWYTCVNISTYTPCIDTYFVYFLLQAYMYRQYINIYWYPLCSHTYSAPRYVSSRPYIFCLCNPHIFSHFIALFSPTVSKSDIRMCVHACAGRVFHFPSLPYDVDFFTQRYMIVDNMINQKNLFSNFV